MEDMSSDERRTLASRITEPMIDEWTVTNFTEKDYEEATRHFNDLVYEIKLCHPEHVDTWRDESFADSTVRLRTDFDDNSFLLFTVTAQDMTEDEANYKVREVSLHIVGSPGNSTARITYTTLDDGNLWKETSKSLDVQSAQVAGLTLRDMFENIALEAQMNPTVPVNVTEVGQLTELLRQSAFDDSWRDMQLE